MDSLTVIKKSASPNWGKAIIVGQRSWIAPHLYQELEHRDLRPEYLLKAEVGDERLTGATLYLIAGVARPTKDEMEREVDLCRRALKTGAKLKYLSSCAVDRWEATSRPLSPEGELYVLGKKRCEGIVCGGPSGCGYALRAPVIFGPGQRLESDMLLPTIVRHSLGPRSAITLNDPFRPFQMVYVADLVTAWVDQDTHDSFPVHSLHTTPEITPIDLVALAAPGLPVFIPPGWEIPESRRTDRDEIYHTHRITVPFKRADVTNTVQWYIEEVPQLVASGTLFLEG